MRTRLSKRADWARRLRSLRRHTILMCQPFIIACAAAVLWTRLRAAGIQLPNEDEIVLTGGLLATLAISFSILAALVLNSIWEKYQKVVICVLQKDKATFMLYRDERIPIMLHLLLASLSIPIIATVVLLEYRSFWSGLLVTFAVTFAICVYWLVTTELQNPAKSPWFGERIPPDWLTKDIDEHFKLGESTDVTADV